MSRTSDGGAEATKDGDVTVLVVDDQPNVAKAYELHLPEAYTVRTATGGAEALELVDESVDVVLLDRRMPEMTGDEVLETIRERGYGCRVAMVTAVDPDFDIVEMDFDAYLTKTVAPEEIRETVDRLATLSDLDEQLREHFVLAEKKATLEATKRASELDEHEEYAELVERLDALETELDWASREFDDEEFAAMFRDPEGGGTG
ncbi:response regulator [Haloplanus halophilus]|uniref:response regulator n=1 Tax=Haloplanus halophilus TaxID=2949993 RepID=UPI00203B7A37|nr:response regulator [Haloplanus sp. GDY1]